MTIILPPAVAARIDEIRRDRTSGAAELGVRSAEAVLELCRSPDVSAEVLRAAAQALVKAQPTMASLFTLANRVLMAGPVHAAQASREFLAQLRSSCGLIGERAAELVADGATVLTHSYSSTVLAALLGAKKAGRRFGVISTESRPLREGVILAKRLAAEGIRVRLVIDAAVCAVLPDASLALVGADSVSPRGLVNKTGTAPLALAARHFGVPLYALGGTEKFLPARYGIPPEEPKDPAEVLPEADPNISVVNRYFESVPLEHFSGIVCEDGVLAPGDLIRRLDDLSVHEALLP